ncbi:cytochrome P450 [bacterium]|nr:cytochrome P450 [bacterium]
MIDSLWNGYQLLMRPYSFLRKERDCWTRLPGLGRVLITGDFEVVSQLARHPGLEGGRAHRAMRATLGDDHLIVMSSAPHRLRSRQVRKALTSFSSDAEVAGLTLEEFGRMPLGRPVSLQAVAHRTSLRIILRGLFGRDDQDLLALCQQFQASFSSPFLLFLNQLRVDLGRWSPWGRLLRRRARLQTALLQAARSAPPDSIAARLPSQIWPQELLPQLMFGHETTAATFAWCFALLYPEARNRIAIGDESFTLAYVQECMRLCPPVTQLTRTAVEECQLGPHRLAPGTVVMPAIPELHHRNWEQPERMQPSRFLRPVDPHQYCPFGIGERICPGKPMALRQLVIMLQTVLQSFKLELVEPPRPRRQLFLVVPARGTPVVRRA